MGSHFENTVGAGRGDRMSEPAMVDAARRGKVRALQGGLKAVILLTLVHVVMSIDKNVLGIALEPIRTEFGLDDRTAGALGGLAYALGFCLTVIPVGLLADRVNRVRLICILLAVWSTMTLLSAFASDVWMLAAARFAVGASEAGAVAIIVSLLSDYFEKDRRSFPMSVYLAGNPIGVAVIYFLGGMVIDASGWRAAFLLAGAPGLILAVVIWLTLKEPARRSEVGIEGAAKPVSLLQTVRGIGADGPLRLSIIGLTLSLLAFTGGIAWTVALFNRVHGMSFAMAGLGLALSIGVAQTAALPLAGMLSDKLTQRDSSWMFLTPIAGALGSIVALTLMVLAPTPEIAMAGLVLLGVTAGATMGPGYSAIVTLAPSGNRAAILSVLMLSFTLIGGGGGPFIVGSLSTGLSGDLPIRWAVLSMTAFFALSAVILCLAMLKFGSRERAGGGVGVAAH